MGASETDFTFIGVTSLQCAIPNVNASETAISLILGLQINRVNVTINAIND